MSALGWNGSTQPPNATLDIKGLISNFKDYVPKYIQIHSVTVYTPRGILGGGVASGESSTPVVYPALINLAFAVFGNWLGFITASGSAAAADLVKQGVIQLAGLRRQKMTYHPYKRDSGIIFDVEIVEDAQFKDANPPLIQLTVDTDLGTVPDVQASDVYVDVNLTRWGFQRTLSFKERMISDPEFRTEQRIKQSKITPIYERIQDEKESSKGEVTRMDELTLEESDSS